MHRVRFEVGQTVLLFTDGLLERRDEDYEGAGTGWCRPPPSCPGQLTGADLEHLVEVMRDPTRDDDVAVLAVRRTG